MQHLRVRVGISSPSEANAAFSLCPWNFEGCESIEDVLNCAPQQWSFINVDDGTVDGRSRWDSDGCECWWKMRKDDPGHVLTCDFAVDCCSSTIISNPDVYVHKHGHGLVYNSKRQTFKQMHMFFTSQSRTGCRILDSYLEETIIKQYSNYPIEAHCQVVDHLTSHGINLSTITNSLAPWLIHLSFQKVNSRSTSTWAMDIHWNFNPLRH